MSNQTIGFVGGGRITRIFLEGWTRARTLPAKITVSDPNAGSLSNLKNRFPGVTTTSDNGVAASQDIVFLAVHPPAVPEAVASIKSGLRPGALLVSLAPKFTTPKLARIAGRLRASGTGNSECTIDRQLRLQPCGFCTCAGGHRTRKRSGALLTPLGECPEVAEEKLEAYAVLTAMAPTFFWFQLQALREVVSGFGLSEAEIAPALKRMVCGTARTLLESGLTPAEVMDLIPVKPLARWSRR